MRVSNLTSKQLKADSTKESHYSTVRVYCHTLASAVTWSVVEDRGGVGSQALIGRADTVSSGGKGVQEVGVCLFKQAKFDVRGGLNLSKLIGVWSRSLTTGE